MRNYVVEFIGTFFLMLAVGMVAINPTPLWFSPIAMGAMVMVMIYAGGQSPVAHYNPAVTLAVFIRGKIQLKEAVFYIIVQVLAAVAVSYIVLYLKGFPTDTPTLKPEAGKAFTAEFLITFALCYVFLNVATSKNSEGNSYFGLAIGFTVIAGAYAVASSSGAFFNPAVTIGQTVIEKNSPDNLWIYLVSQFLAGIAAGLVYRFTNTE